MLDLNLNQKFSKKAPNKDLTERSAVSKFGRFLNDSKTKIAVTGASVLVALGLTFIPPVNVAHAEGKKGKGADVKKEKEKIDIDDLKGYTTSDYERLNENENGFFFDIAREEPLFMEDGEKAVKIIGSISHDKEDLKVGGDKASYVMILLFNGSFGGKSEAGWIIDLEDLRKEYKELTGKELKYVHALVEHDEGSSGEFLQLYLIPASSKKAVEKEIIESDMPIKIVKLKKDAESGEYKLGSILDSVTAALEKPDDKILAKK